MDVSLCSSLNSAKPAVLPHVFANNRRRPSMFIPISCRATKFAGENETTDFYKVLSLSPNNAGADEIKRAYRSMALQYHPDVCHPSMKEESTRMFVQLNVAYKTLSDPVLRKEYDCGLSLRNFGRTYKMDISDRGMRNRWENQILELKRRSNYRKAQKEGSWGSKLRAQNR